MTAKLTVLAADHYQLREVTARHCRFTGMSSGFTVLVPLAEIGDGRLHATEKGVVLLKWIRRAREEATATIPQREAEGNGQG